MRLAMDYAMGSDCMNGNCDCREEYLQASTDLLVSDPEWVTAQWADYGNARVRDGG
jgi:putative iron-regulated protein